MLKDETEPCSEPMFIRLLINICSLYLFSNYYEILGVGEKLTGIRNVRPIGSKYLYLGTYDLCSQTVLEELRVYSLGQSHGHYLGSC